MPICPACGASLPEDTRFCPFDGTALLPAAACEPAREDPLPETLPDASGPEPREVKPTTPMRVSAPPQDGPLQARGADQADLAPAEAEAPDPLIGKVIDNRYRIQSRIGAGGIGAVYLGEQIQIRRKVAVKVLHPLYAASAEFRRRFEREATEASRAVHPSCVTVLDFGSFEGRPYLVMELVEGEILSEHLLHHPLSPSAGVRIALEILAALRHAHGLGIVHRDIKPENIMLCDPERTGARVKLLDFGLAKNLEPDGPGTQLTRLGAVFGTPAYISPEQASGVPADLRSDIYSMGVLLFEMVCGRKPYLHDDPTDMMRAHIVGTPPRAGEVRPGLSAELEQVIARALQKNRSSRFQTAEEFAGALQQVPEARAGAPSPSFPALFTPVPATSFPGSVPSLPGPASSTPVPATSLPGPAASSLAPSPSAPALSSPGSAPSPSFPATSVPGTAPSLPDQAMPTPVPATYISSPASSSPGAAPSSSVQASSLPGPVSPGPAASIPVPATSIPVPATSTPGPAASIPVPATSIPVPATSIPVPATGTLATGQTTGPDLGTSPTLFDPSRAPSKGVARPAPVRHAPGRLLARISRLRARAGIIAAAVSALVLVIVLAWPSQQGPDGPNRPGSESPTHKMHPAAGPGPAGPLPPAGTDPGQPPPGGSPGDQLMQRPATAQLRRAVFHLRAGRLEQAIRIAQKVSFRRRQDPLPHLLLGHAYFERLWHTDAIKEYARALARDPSLRSDPVVQQRVIACLARPSSAQRARRLLLDELGDAARPALQAAAEGHDDPQVRMRAREILDVLEGR